MNPDGALYKIYNNLLNKDAGNTATTGVEKKTRKFVKKEREEQRLDEERRKEIEKLIVAGTIDRETGLSYATNRTNLQLRLDTQSGAPDSTESIRLKDEPRSTGSFRAVDPARRTGALRPGNHGRGGGQGGPPAGGSDMDDLIER